MEPRFKLRFEGCKALVGQFVMFSTTGRLGKKGVKEVIVIAGVNAYFAVYEVFPSAVSHSIVVCVIQAPLAFSAPLGCPEQHQTGPQV